MLTLNLCNPEESDIEYKAEPMPDGQPHIVIEECDEDINIICSLSSMNEIGKLSVAVDAINSYGYGNDVFLTILYFLGARQDKQIRGEALTVKVMSDIINNLVDGYDICSVEVLHPHSQCAINLLGNGIEIDHTQYVEETITDFEPAFLIIPDAGAAKNAQKYDKFGLPQVQCLKKRDPKTGKLSGFRVVDDIPEGRKAMIIDDICDGGKTFLGLGELFENELALYTTHGLYTKGTEELLKRFTKLYSTDSYPSKHVENVTRFKIN